MTHGRPCAWAGWALAAGAGQVLLDEFSHEIGGAAVLGGCVVV